MLSAADTYGAGGQHYPGDFTMYFGAVAGVSQWLNDITKQVEKINRFSVQCCEFRDFLEMPDGFVNDGKECLDTEGNRPVDITFEHVFSVIRTRRRIRFVI